MVQKHWWVNPSVAVSLVEGQEEQRGSALGRGGGGGPWDGGSGEEDGLGCIGWARMGGGPDGQWEIWGGASLESESLNRWCVGQLAGGGGDEGAPFGEGDSTCVAGIAA